MIEALGQLCVFYLLKGEHASLSEKVDPNTIFFTSCDGVKCRRICKPGDVLQMQIKVNRVRHPLASFQGEITVEGQKPQPQRRLNSRLIIIRLLTEKRQLLRVK